jgi:hypothetical protein
MTQESFYCVQQIKIPSELPDVLKQFTKAAIRTQPADIHAWALECVFSDIYFFMFYKTHPPPGRYFQGLTHGHAGPEAGSGLPIVAAPAAGVFVRSWFFSGCNNLTFWRPLATDKATTSQLAALAAALRAGPEELSRDEVEAASAAVGLPAPVVSDALQFVFFAFFFFLFSLKMNGTLTNPCPLRPPDWDFLPVWSRGGASWPCARQPLSR